MFRLADAIQRAFEVFLGSVLFMAGLVPIVFGIGAALEFLDDSSQWPTFALLLAVAVAAPVAWWCFGTAWRLVTGRERQTGGLLSPAALVVAGTACLGLSVTAVVSWGVLGLARAGEFFVMGVAAFALARSRTRSTIKELKSVTSLA